MAAKRSNRRSRSAGRRRSGNVHAPPLTSREVSALSRELGDVAEAAKRASNDLSAVYSRLRHEPAAQHDHMTTIYLAERALQDAHWKVEAASRALLALSRAGLTF